MAQVLYNAIEVTTGRNGYPSNCYHVTAGFSTFEEAEQYAQENEGEVVLLHRKDGWQLWENKGRIYEAPTRTAEDEGDDYAIYTANDKETLVDELKEDIAEMADSFTAISFMVETYREIFEAIDNLEEGEAVLTSAGKAYHSTIELHPMEWHDTDNNQYMVAVRE